MSYGIDCFSYGIRGISYWISGMTYGIGCISYEIVCISYEIGGLSYGICCMFYVICCLYGICSISYRIDCMSYGIGRLSYGICRMFYGIDCMSCMSYMMDFIVFCMLLTIRPVYSIDCLFYCKILDNLSCVMRKLNFCLCENRAADQLCSNAQLTIAFVFATRIV